MTRSRRKWENAFEHDRRAVAAHWYLQNLNFVGIDITRIRERDLMLDSLNPAQALAIAGHDFAGIRMVTPFKTAAYVDGSLAQYAFQQCV
jgi:hypothetical protein